MLPSPSLAARPTVVTTSKLNAYDNPADAATLATLSPGTYTAQIHARGRMGGVALAEIYEIPSPDTPVSQLINLSARAQVTAGTGTLTAGFAVGGNGPQRLLIRAIGPTLGKFGVSGALADPTLVVTPLGGSTPLQSNDDWGGTAALSAAFAQVGAFPLESGSRDSAVLQTVTPGAYTVTVSGKGGGEGVALVEVYMMP